jgi:hypothetical protein
MLRGSVLFRGTAESTHAHLDRLSCAGQALTAFSSTLSPSIHTHTHYGMSSRFQPNTFSVLTFAKWERRPRRMLTALPSRKRVPRCEPRHAMLSQPTSHCCTCAARTSKLGPGPHAASKINAVHPSSVCVRPCGHSQSYPFVRTHPPRRCLRIWVRSCLESGSATRRTRCECVRMSTVARCACGSTTLRTRSLAQSSRSSTRPSRRSVDIVPCLREPSVFHGCWLTAVARSLLRPLLPLCLPSFRFARKAQPGHHGRVRTPAAP